MRLTMFGKLKAHLHLVFEVPAAEGIIDLIPGFSEGDNEAHLDLKMVDRDGDGDPEFEVKWNLPGTKFDSGPEPRKVEIPLSVVLGPVADFVATALAGVGAPAPIVLAAKIALS